MDTRSWAREMALYSKWQNQALYGHCDALGEEVRRQDRGMFFGSVHATLDHILMVDEALSGYFVHGNAPTAFDPNRRLHEEWSALKAARDAFDADLLAMIDARPPGWLDESIGYSRAGWEHGVQVPRMAFAMQMFNHATHHRSQVTAELHKLGIDYGITDLPYNPLSQWWR